MIKNLLLFVCLWGISCVSAQNEKPTREAFALKIQLNNKQFYGQQIGDSPYFAEEQTLQIYADERVYVEAEVQNGKIISLKSVQENIHPEKTFDIEFCQTIENGISTASLLYIKNPFDKKLKYSLLLYGINSSKWEPESHFVKAKMTGFQSWKNVLGSIVIRAWEFE